MKKVIFILLILVISISAFSQSFTLKGVVKSKDVAVSGVTITNETTKRRTTTDSKGQYSIAASIGDVISYNSIGYTSIKKTLIDSNDLDLDLEASMDMTDVVVVGFSSPGPSLSMRNFWTGAKIGYNFTANTDDDFFVGSASISLNLLDNKDTRHTFGVVGNIGKFKFNKDTSDTKGIQKLSQSINGLLVGLGYTHETKIVGENPSANSKMHPISYFRKFIVSGARLTSYKYVGKDSATINFPQSVTTVGFEFEQTGFKNGGSLTVSTGLSMLLFDKNLYNMIFKEEKKSLFVFDASIILPISKTMGFFINGSFARKNSGIYIIGVVFKS